MTILAALYAIFVAYTLVGGATFTAVAINGDTIRGRVLSGYLMKGDLFDRCFIKLLANPANDVLVQDIERGDSNSPIDNAPFALQLINVIL